MTSICSKKVECPYCKENFDINYYTSLNVTINPELINGVYDGEINIVHCPKCNKHVKIIVDVIFHDMEKKDMIIFKDCDPDWLANYLKEKGYKRSSKEFKPIKTFFN